jgi:hypothetical protein
LEFFGFPWFYLEGTRALVESRARCSPRGYGRAKKAQMDRPDQRRVQRPAELIDSQKGSHQS